MTAIRQKSGKRQKRKIRFHERVQFKTIRHVSEFTDDEISNGWYDKDDFNRMSENVSDIAQLIADGKKYMDGEELCTRGLEHIVEEELADYRAEKMINSIDAVLDEQEEQWDEGKEEPLLIAELYAEYAKPLLKEAHLIGLKDAEQGYKTWDELLDEPDYRHLKKQKRVGSPSTKGKKTMKSGANKTQVKKSYQSSVKKPDKSKKDKTSREKPKQTFSSSSQGSSSSSSESQPATPRSSRFMLTRQNSTSSTNSCTLRDYSMRSFSAEDPVVAVSKEKSTQLPLKGIDENGDAPASPKKQRKGLRRTPSQRKNGSEASPFVYNRQGTLTFRKPDVEKLKREKREKRKNCIRGSLGKFLVDDDEEEDILAGILSGK